MVTLDLTDEEKYLLRKLQADIDCTQKELVSMGLVLLWDFYNYQEQKRESNVIDSFVESRLRLLHDNNIGFTYLTEEKKVMHDIYEILHTYYEKYPFKE
jgi:hypothetical protein